MLFSAVCLGCWANAFKLTGARWRFELFYLDFSLGALLFSVVAALVLGNAGSDFAFADRLLISGRMAQGSAVAGGMIFNIGNLLLIGAVSLIGMSTAFPVTFGTALIVGALFNLRGDNALVIGSGIAFMLAGAGLSGRACQLREGASTASKVASSRLAPSAQQRRLAKGLIVSALGGIFLGFYYPVAVNGVVGEFGLGPYAGMLFFTLGIAASTIVLELCSLAFALEGGPLKMSAYARGGPKAHLLGVAGGMVCAAGVFSIFLIISNPGQRSTGASVPVIVPAVSVLLAIMWGAFAWKEFAKGSGKARLYLFVSGVAFVGALVLAAKT